MKNLPVGIQTFKDIINGNFLYVDKTKYIYELVKLSKGAYFISRPRRFGKSLTISTLEAIFKNEQDLFKEFWISKSDYQWQEYPIIKLDMTSVSNYTGKMLDKILNKDLNDISEKYKVKIDLTYPAKVNLKTLIHALYNKYGKVVVLIDEYDKPILDNISNVKIADANRKMLSDFYSVIKSEDACIRFVFLTGVTKFSKVSVFSGLNNLEDLTMTDSCAAMLGYTQEELESNFSQYIDKFIDRNNINKNTLLTMIMSWYHGFKFSKNGAKVYNPFSISLFFKYQDFKNYWFESATPTFLINLIKEYNYNIYEAENSEVSEDNFSVFEIDRILPEPKQDFSSRSRQIKILTTGIHRVFRGLKFLFNAEIGEKDHFRSGTK